MRTWINGILGTLAGALIMLNQLLAGSGGSAAHQAGQWVGFALGVALLVGGLYWLQKAISGRDGG